MHRGIFLIKPVPCAPSMPPLCPLCVPCVSVVNPLARPRCEGPILKTGPVEIYPRGRGGAASAALAASGEMQIPSQISAQRQAAAGAAGGWPGHPEAELPRGLQQAALGGCCE